MGLSYSMLLIRKKKKGLSQVYLGKMTRTLADVAGCYERRILR